MRWVGRQIGFSVTAPAAATSAPSTEPPSLTFRQRRQPYPGARPRPETGVDQGGVIKPASEDGSVVPPVVLRCPILHSGDEDAEPGDEGGQPGAGEE